GSRGLLELGGRAELKESPLAHAHGGDVSTPRHVARLVVGVPDAELGPGVALVGNLYLRAQHEHGKALRDRRGEVARELQQETVWRGDHEKACKQPSFR